MSIDVMKQALAALELWSPASGHALNKRAEAVVALRAAIEQAQSEPPPVQESALTHNHLWIGDLYGRDKNK